MELTISEFANVTSLSHKNVEIALSNIIAESQNCVLHSMYDDKILLIDVSKDRLYEASYTFDGDKFKIDNFEEIELVEEKAEFENIADAYFEGKVSKKQLAEGFTGTREKQDSDFVEKLIYESVSEHNPQTSLPYEEFHAIKNEVDLDEIRESKFFKYYQQKNIDEGFNEIEYFTFENPVTINLNELNHSRKIKYTSKEKAKNLWKNKNFRSSICEAFNMFVEDVEGGSNSLKRIYSLYTDFYILDESEEEEVISKALLINGIKATEIDSIIEGYKIAKDKFGINEAKQEYLENVDLLQEETADEIIARAEQTGGDSSTPPADDATPPADDATPPTEEKPKEEEGEKVENEDLQKLMDKLDEMSKKVSDDDESGVKEFIKNLTRKIEELKDNEETQPEFVKKVVDLLQ